MRVLCEFWCSPLRKEVYSDTYISLCTEHHYVLDEINENYVNDYGDFWEDVFGEGYEGLGGLYKVVCNIEVEWKQYNFYEGIETEVLFSTEVLFKSKCSCLSELKWKWLELTGKTQDYFDKVIDKQFKITREGE